jgi:hypothetical protein
VTIEQRLRDAILDVQGMLAEGLPKDVAVEEAASTYSLGKAVLEERATKALGPLDLVHECVSRQAAAAREQSASKAAIHAYASSGSEQPAWEWLASRLGRPPTYEEHREALSRSMERWLTAHANELRD